MCKSKKGFTMVELLCAIVILGLLSVLGIKSLSGMMDKANESKHLQQEKTLTMAAESYIQAYRSKLPRIVGEKTIIPISDLKSAKFLKEDIKNEKGDSCMAKSYVVIFKSSKSEYEYTTYLICGDENPPTDAETEPDIDIYFTDSSDNKITDLTKVNKIKKSKLNVEMTAGKYNGNSIAIYSYNISIMVNGKEAYNSGSVSANKKNNVKVSKLLSDYVDISTNSNETKINIKVTARSVDGGVATESKQVGFLDKKAPEGCGNLKEEPPSGPENWINVKSSRKYRTITIPCDDGDGSGCTRDVFVGTWNKQKQAKTATMKIKDNAGNETECSVRAYVDLDPPMVTIKKKTTDSGAKNLFDNDVVKQGDSGNVIKTTDYKYASSNGWVINEHYPKALNFEIVLEDNLNLASWKYETNDTNIWDDNASNYSLVKLNNSDASKEVKSISGKSSTIKISLGNDGRGNVLEGKRYGKLTVIDEAGNETIVVIKANIDVTLPVCDLNVSYPNGNPNSYNWLHAGQNAIVSRYCDDGNGSGCDANSMAAKSFNYNTDINTTSAGAAGDGNSGTVKDIAGNVATCPHDKIVKIDTKKPTCNLDISYPNGEPTSFGWLGKNKTAKVSTSCTDTGGNTPGGSGCDTASFNSKIYDYEMQTNYAGAIGISNSGTVKDLAGNESSTCPANKTVKIDYTSPTCEVKADYGAHGGPNEAGWLHAGQNVIIYSSCTDTGGSGCNSSSQNFVEYVNDIKVNNAGAISIGNSGKVKDKADNESAQCPADKKVWIDTRAPRCSANIEISYYGSDPIEHGPPAYYYNAYTGKGYYSGDNDVIGGYSCDSDPSVNGVSSGCTDTETHSIDYSLWEKFPDTEGQVTVQGESDAYDVAGNVSTCSGSKQIYVDTRGPNIGGLLANSWTSYATKYYAEYTYANDVAIQLGYDVPGRTAAQIWSYDQTRISGFGFKTDSGYLFITTEGYNNELLIQRKNWYAGTSAGHGTYRCYSYLDHLDYESDIICNCYCVGKSYSTRKDLGHEGPEIKNGKLIPFTGHNWQKKVISRYNSPRVEDYDDDYSGDSVDSGTECLEEC